MCLCVCVRALINIDREWSGDLKKLPNIKMKKISSKDKDTTTTEEKQVAGEEEAGEDCDGDDDDELGDEEEDDLLEDVEEMTDSN